MWPYLLFFAIAGIPALFHSRKKHRVGWAIAWLVCVLFVGLRHEVGGDWLSYLLITDRIHRMDLLEALKDQEILFSALTWLSTRFGAGVYGVNLVGSIIVFTGLFAYCGRQESPWLALAASLPFLVVVAVMSANRQGMAIGIVLLVMSRWESLGILKRSAGIGVAALFHTSAAFLLLLTVVDVKMARWKKVVLFVLVAGASLWLMSRSGAAFTRYTQTYVRDQADYTYSPGAIFHLILNLVPALIMLASQKRWQAAVPSWRLIRQLCLITVGLLFLVPFFSLAVGRISLYLFPVSIVFVATLPRFIPRPEGRALARTVLVAALGGVLALWLSFANMAYMYIPYRNAMIVPSFDLALPR